MSMKSKKAEKIKKCLKIGVPVAVLGIGAALKGNLHADDA